eukprot:m.134514 g.134514  ORF g.134514 m.134514 type:complete len:50 (-) comp13959_c0_seq4:1282-1431(-)
MSSCTSHKHHLNGTTKMKAKRGLFRHLLFQQRQPAMTDFLTPTIATASR